MTSLTRHPVLDRVRKLRSGGSRRQHVLHRLSSIEPVRDSNHHHDPTDLVSVLSSLARSLRGGDSLRQAIAGAGNLESTGVIHFLAQRLSSDRSLDQACADFRAIHTARRRRPHSEDEAELVIGVIELAHSMGGDEARLIDSLIHSLIERRHIRHERQAHATTALSSMRMLTWLPVICGLWILTEKNSSRTFVLHTAIGRICLIGGIILNLLGRLWAQRIVLSS